MNAQTETVAVTTEIKANRGQLTTPEALYTYIKGGHGKLTVKSLSTDQRFVYRFSRLKEDQDRRGKELLNRPIFVCLVTGRDFDKWPFIGTDWLKNWPFIGTCWLKPDQRIQFNTSRKNTADIPPRALVAFEFLVSLVTRQKLPSKIEIWHEGKCCICGRELTDPTSIAQGYGPVCADKL